MAVAPSRKAGFSPRSAAWRASSAGSGSIRPVRITLAPPWPEALPNSALPRQRAGALRKRAVGLVGRDGRPQLVVVPGAARFGGLLHLVDVHLMDHAAVRADAATLGEEVVDRR